MPPLTLEQVLARSMRLPRRRSTAHVSSLFGAAESTVTSVASPNRYTAITATTSTSSSTLSTRQDKLQFFALMETEEAARTAGRLSIHRSDQLVRNHADLTTFLRAAEQTGAWTDALHAFAAATNLSAFAQLATFGTGAAQSTGIGTTKAPEAAPFGITPTLPQVLALMNACAAAGKVSLVERIGVFFAPTFPEAFLRAVEVIASAAPTDGNASPSNTSTMNWRVAFEYVCQQCPLPAAEVPVAAYNVCLSGCEAARDWRGALEVVRAMGPNPLQDWIAPEEKEKDGKEVVVSATNSNSSSGSAAASEWLSTLTADRSDAPASNSLSSPPSPDVVSYATLIATLEQAGKDHVASAVLNRLPAVEKEEITASYAALIHVWSDQVLRKHRRRF